MGLSNVQSKALSFGEHSLISQLLVGSFKLCCPLAMYSSLRLVGQPPTHVSVLAHQRELSAPQTMGGSPHFSIHLTFYR